MSFAVDVIHKTVTRSSKQSPCCHTQQYVNIKVLAREVILNKPVLAEVDGDILSQSTISFTVDRKALLCACSQLGSSAEVTEACRLCKDKQDTCAFNRHSLVNHRFMSTLLVAQ